MIYIAVSQFFTASECKLVDNHVTSLIVFMVPGVNNFKPGHISVLHASNTLVSMKAESVGFELSRIYICNG